MSRTPKWLTWACPLVLCALFCTPPARAYIEAPYTLGRIINESSNIVVIRVVKVDREKNLIIYEKVRDLKGRQPEGQIKHNIGQNGFNPREWQYVMAATDVGKLAVMMHAGKEAEICIDYYWYQVTPQGEWSVMLHGEPFLMRSFYGRPEKLITIVEQMLAGKEVAVPCLQDGDKNAIAIRQARVQKLRASLTILDYDAKRDFLGFGADDFRRLTGMPAFSMYGTVPSTAPGAWGVATADVNGDGQEDALFYGQDKVVLLISTGTGVEEAMLPCGGGARSACFGDVNADRRPDLLLATPTGPKLLLNDGSGTFIDVSAQLPTEAYWNLTGAALIAGSTPADQGGRPDILLANGFLGLRLYRNITAQPAVPEAAPAPRASGWKIIGPFDNPEGTRGFDIAYPPEAEIDLRKTYPGKNGTPCAWKEADLPDGQINSFLPLLPADLTTRGVVYLYRELECAAPVGLPISLGSDDTLTVWLNGEKIVAQNVARGAAADQAMTTLRLRAGTNRLLLKICQGDGEWGFYYAAKPPAQPPAKLFVDVSSQVGLGPSGIAGTVRGDRLLVADINGDGRQDFLYCAGRGIVALNTPQGFVASRDHGLDFATGRLLPAFGHITGTGPADLAVPQNGAVKLYRNDGQGRFTDVTARAGDPAKFTGNATSVAFANFFGAGRQDLIVGCQGAINRIYRNNGDGTFTDATDECGLGQRVYDTRALAVFDMNKDGIADLALNNEGQESCILVGAPGRAGK
jgi:hypothetical protein